MSFYLEKSKNNLWLGKFSTVPDTVAVHAVSTRFGGVSQGAYRSLNLALHVGDVVADVLENRRRFTAALGLQAESIVSPEQVHGDSVYQVTKNDLGRGSQAYEDAIKGTDALMTNEPGVPLMLCYADCTPIILLDPVQRAGAVVHGGWKGTAASIAVKTLLAMGNAYGTKPQDCLALIGPAIGGCCYEVGDEVVARFKASFPSFADNIINQAGGRPHLDLPLANRLQLMAAGVPSYNIDMAEVCTDCNPEVVFSYRADNGKTGRIAALLALR